MSGEAMDMSEANGIGEVMSIDEAMKRALALAGEAAGAGDVPVGAVVLDAQGCLIGEGYNTREAEGDPLAHAEIVAMRQAAGQVGIHTVAPSVPAAAQLAAQASHQPSYQPSTRAWNLADCTLVVTLEPCPMCAGACVATHIGRIVFGAWDSKLGACGSVWDIPRDPHIGHSPEVFGGIMHEECSAALADFFAARRSAV